jgi:WD40 repeat protein
MTLWQCSDRSLLRQWNLQGKRANSVTFNGDDEILEADKAGDVFKFSASAKDDDNGTLVLGHLSMLIDLAITPCGKYVITADRDEKIRVSNYPNAFSIHSFCLGHTEFITSLALVSSSPDLLLSSSGDGTVKCWDFKAGKEHSSRLCYEDAGMSLMEEQDEEEEQQNRGGGDEFWRKSRQTPAVKGITVHEYSSGETVVAVNVEGFRGVLIYSLDVAEKSKLKFVQKLETSSDLWAFGFARSTSDLWLLESEEPHFSVCSRQQDDGKFDVVEDKRPEVNPSVKKMLQGMFVFLLRGVKLFNYFGSFFRRQGVFHHWPRRALKALVRQHEGVHDQEGEEDH